MFEIYITYYHTHDNFVDLRRVMFGISRLIFYRFDIISFNPSDEVLTKQKHPFVVERPISTHPHPLNDCVINIVDGLTCV
jgi:hypothetical protein